MSLQTLRRLLEELPSLEQRELKLLRFEGGPECETAYTSRTIQLYPADEMDKFLADIQEEYIQRKRLVRYTEVEKYSGTVETTKIYSLAVSDTLVKGAYENMVTSLANPKTETDPIQFGANAYVLQGVWNNGDGEIPVKLIAVMSPFKKLKHKFFYDEGTFKEITEDVLDLRLYADVIVVGEKIYFLGLAGEKLLGMERAYRINSQKLAEEFAKVPFFMNGEVLKTTALSAQYPRMLTAYQSSKMDYLKVETNRRAIAQKFRITIEKDGTLDMAVPGNAEKLIRFLCNRGMLDPTDQGAMEVAGAKRWV